MLYISFTMFAAAVLDERLRRVRVDMDVSSKKLGTAAPDQPKFQTILSICFLNFYGDTRIPMDTLADHSQMILVFQPVVFF